MGAGCATVHLGTVCWSELGICGITQTSKMLRVANSEELNPLLLALKGSWTQTSLILSAFSEVRLGFCNWPWSEGIIPSEVVKPFAPRAS